MNFKTFSKFSKIQYQYTKLLRCTLQNNFFASADFQILHSSVYNHSGSDVMYLSLLSVSVTVKKCDSNFSVKIKALNFKVKFSGNF